MRVNMEMTLLVGALFLSQVTFGCQGDYDILAEYKSQPFSFDYFAQVSARFSDLCAGVKCWESTQCNSGTCKNAPDPTAGDWFKLITSGVDPATGYCAMTDAMVAGIVIAIVVVVLAIGLLTFCCWRKRQQKLKQQLSMHQPLY